MFSTAKTTALVNNRLDYCNFLFPYIDLKYMLEAIDM